MKGRFNLLTLPAGVLGASLLAACNDPTTFDSSPVINEPEEEEICQAHPEWLPNTPDFATDEKSFFKPAPHPEGECPFYSLAWQNFLLATQPIDAAGTPAIKTYPTIDDIFEPLEVLPAGALAPAGMPRGTATRSWLGDIKQAGERQVAIDTHGHTIYYGIHTNQAFADFIKDRGLTTAKAVQEADPKLFFPAGMVEFKSAWQKIDDPSMADGYITTEAYVPHISVDAATKTLIEDRNRTERITVRLLALHVVATFPGHPEFLWGHFEHTAVDMSPDSEQQDFKAEHGFRDVAPITIHRGADNVLLNPSDDDPNNDQIVAPVAVTPPNGANAFALYNLNTPTNQANRPKDEAELVQVFDEATQTFRNGATPVSTPIYRIFPASKSNTTHPDDAISSLNHNVESLFRQRAAEGALDDSDKRKHYRLAGAQWMDKPSFFAINSPLQNNELSPLLQNDRNAHPELDEVQAGERADVLATGATGVDDILANGADSAFSILAGEDRLSGTPLESFTQSPNSFNNCFTCHNTQAIASNGVPFKGPNNGRLLMPPKLLNVSHVLSQFVLEQCDKPMYRKPLRDLPDTSRLKADFVPVVTDLSSLVAECPPQPGGAMP